MTEQGRTFEVDVEKRTIFGLAVPYGTPTFSEGARFQFALGVIVLPEDPTRVKLLVQHDGKRAVGKATDLSEDDRGLWARFSVAPGAEGDQALSMAAHGTWDGLSVGLREGAKFSKKSGVHHFTTAQLREISLTPDPAFDTARVAAVVAEASTERTGPMTDTTTPELTAPTFDVAALGQAIAAAMPAPREVIPAGTPLVSVTEHPYAFDADRAHFVAGGSHEFSADVIAASRGDREAGDRALGFVQEQFAVAQINVQTALPAQASKISYVDRREYAFPLTSALGKGSLANGSPFAFPRFNSAAGLVGPHTEGVEPTPGSFSTTSQTVTPRAMSGKVEITREVWDQGGSPQLSGLIFAKMVKGYYEAAEALIVAELTAQAANITDIALTAGGANKALVAELTGALADLQFVRGGFAFDVLAAQAGLYRALATAADDAGRPLLPASGPSNANGSAGARFGSLDVNGVRTVPTWALSADSWLIDSSSVHAWMTTPQRLDFQYRVAFVDMAIWGYQATAVSDTAGVRQITYAAA